MEPVNVLPASAQAFFPCPCTFSIHPITRISNHYILPDPSYPYDIMHLLPTSTSYYPASRWTWPWTHCKKMWGVSLLLHLVITSRASLPGSKTQFGMSLPKISVYLCPCPSSLSISSSTRHISPPQFYPPSRALFLRLVLWRQVETQKDNFSCHHSHLAFLRSAW